MDNTINKLLVDALSTEQTKKMLQRFGFSPNLPYVVSTIEDEMTYSPEDIAQLLNYTPQHIRRLCTKGVITSFHISPKSRHRIFGEEIKKFILNKLTQPSFLQRTFEKP